MVALALTTQVSCRWLQPSDTASSGSATAPALVERLRIDARPSMVLLAREGDPQPAVALAFAHDYGSQASAALAALLAERLAKRGFPATVVDVHALGAGLSTLAADSEEAARFIREASTAVQSPVRSDDPVLDSVNTQVQALQALAWGGAAERQVALCSGELGVGPHTPPTDFRVPAWAAALERWRARVASTETVRFAAVGPAAVLARAADAVRELAAWPDGTKPDDPWPSSDYVGVDLSAASTKTLSIALRVGDAKQAVEAAHELALPSSALRVRLGAVAPAWKLDRVAATTRPRGACLRIDFTGPSGDDPGWKDTARLVHLGLYETRGALSAARVSRSNADESLVRPADPRRAASAAAWRALADQQPPGPTRQVIALATRFATTPAEAAAQLQTALSRETGARRARQLDFRVRSEAGQAEVWALLASPCAAGAATSTASASPALFVTAAAMLQPRFGPVVVEPWVSPLGIGLIAHGPRAFPEESPKQHARRVASALGRVLLQASSGNTHALLSARSELLDQLGSTPRPGWWLTLDSLSNGHVAWLEPRGNWDSLRDATMEGAREQWSLFLSGPLRLAVLANSDLSQGDEIRAGLERWLNPVLAQRWACPAPPAQGATAGEHWLRGRAALDSDAGAYIASRVPSGQYEHARWTAWLLNRPSGWLERSLEQPELVSSARAQVVGRPDFAVLVVEVRALDGRLDQAVAQLRALMDRLASGAATQQEFASARAAFAAARANGALEPHNRLVELWGGPEPGSVASLKALRAFHTALRSDRLTIVVVDPAE